MGLLRLTIGYLKAIVVHIRVTLGHLKVIIVKLRQGSGKDRQGMAVKAKGLKA